MLGLIAALVCAAPPVGATEDTMAGDDATPLRTVVEDVREDPDGLDEQRRVDARHTGFATVVDLEFEAGARPADALAEVLARSPGATVRSIGGLGQFSSVSLRGSTGQQVPIFVEGVPVGGDLAGLTNLGDIPLDALERVEIYRGHVPIRYGGAAIGGAIDLVGAGRPRRPSGQGVVGVGSFGAREARATAAVPLGDGGARNGVGVTARAGYSGADGNFRFYDTGGTPQLFDDDRISRRRNNGYDRGLAQLRFDGRHGDWRWSAQQLGTIKRAEVPGPATAQATTTALGTSTVRTIARVDRRGVGGPGGSVSWLASLGWEQRTFSDPLGEVGLGVDDQRTRSLDAYVSPRLRVSLWAGAFLSVNADARWQRSIVDDRTGGTGTTDGDAFRARTVWGVAAELEQFAVERRLAVVPALRVDGVNSRFAVPEGSGEVDDAGVDTFVVATTPRVGVRFRIIEGLTLRSTAGRYFRPPSLLELFGDRGYAVGNEGLRPESGTSLDAGIVVDRRAREVGIYGQAVAFWTRSEDLIQWIQAGPVVRPENIADAFVAGVEASLQITAPERWIVLMGNYTFAHSVNLDRATLGQPLPGRPRHQGTARASFGHERRIGGVWIEPRLFGTVDAISGNFLDPNGRLDVPPRVLAGLGAELHVARRVDLAVEIRNLFDRKVVAWTPPVGGAGVAVPAPISDFIGYPLPSRSVWANARVRF